MTQEADKTNEESVAKTQTEQVQDLLGLGTGYSHFAQVALSRFPQLNSLLLDLNAEVEAEEAAKEATQAKAAPTTEAAKPTEAPKEAPKPAPEAKAEAPKAAPTEEPKAAPKAEAPKAEPKEEKAPEAKPKDPGTNTGKADSANTVVKAAPASSAAKPISTGNASNKGTVTPSSGPKKPDPKSKK